jgi:hypothetical protein
VDGSYTSHAPALKVYRDFCRTYELTPEEEANILGKTAAKLLGLDTK